MANVSMIHPPMTNEVEHENTRRQFLRYGLSIASGVIVPLGVTACEQSEGDHNKLPLQTFVQPPLLEAKNGLLDVTLTVSYFDTQLSGSNPRVRHPVSLRAYGYDSQRAGYCGPTFVVRGGDELRVRLLNQLPENPPFQAFRDPTNYIKPNTTNLHAHGLHVFPGIYDDVTPPEYGDYVVDPNYGGVVPNGDSRQYVYRIPKDHPAGPFYYHPQYHGSSALQAASLMSGALMVRGAVDDLPDMAQATELIFLFQAPYFALNTFLNDGIGVADGRLEKFRQLTQQPTGQGVKKNSVDEAYSDAQPVLINGVRQPTIVMRSGEVQRWRLINTQVFNSLNLRLDDHVLKQYTTDGWGSAEYVDHGDARKTNGQNLQNALGNTSGLSLQHASGNKNGLVLQAALGRSNGLGLQLAPGNRASALIQAGKPGTYYLRGLPVKLSEGARPIVLPEYILAKVIVVDSKDSMSIPKTPLPVSRFLDPITDDELANNGGKKRNIIFKMTGNESLLNAQQATGVLAQATDVLASLIAKAEQSFQHNKLQLQQKISSTFGSQSQAQVYPPPPNLRPPFDIQAANTLHEIAILDAVEEWTVFNMNHLAHVFHIHVNPMYIIKVNGTPIEPYWCDTVALPTGGTGQNPSSVTFRMRFKDFIGPYILHNQRLQASDLGMIQRVTVVSAGLT
jgi:FtsP/CotA-like multicopper oxidase with cupredoxin domain